MNPQKRKENLPPDFERIDGCPKRAYKRRRDAIKAARRSSKALWAYLCDRGDHWHLTSRRGERRGSHTR